MRWRVGRPSNSVLVGFALALAVTSAGAGGIAWAASRSGGEQAPARVVAADPSPDVPGLAPLRHAYVPADGLLVGAVRVLPTGTVPSTSYRDHAGPGETLIRWDPTIGGPKPAADLLKIPSSPAWSIEYGGAEYAISAAGVARVTVEGAVIKVAGARHDWDLSSGTMAKGGQFEDTLMERDTANFTYTTGGVSAFVFDASPSLALDRAWSVRLVVGNRWVALHAPVVPFEQVAAFIDALVEANR